MRGRDENDRFPRDEPTAQELFRAAPSARLAGAVDGYCDYRLATGKAADIRQLPHAQGVLIVNLGEPIEIEGGDGRVLRLRGGQGFFAGPHLRPALSRSFGSQAGVHVFLPLSTLRRLAGGPMSLYLDRVAPLESVLDAQARELCEAIGEARDAASRVSRLDAALARILEARDPLDPSQRFALRLLRERPDLDIVTIANEIGWSRKHLAARVRDAVGVGPRCWRRLMRLQRLLAAAGDGRARPAWTALAFDAGYFDQSHMIREFKEFCGLTPSAYWDRLRPGGGVEA